MTPEIRAFLLDLIADERALVGEQEILDRAERELRGLS